MTFLSNCTRRISAMLLILALLIGLHSGPAYAAIDGSREAPKISAKRAALYSVTTDEMIYTREPDKKVDPYSTTKLMTALLAAENLAPDQKVTVTREAAEIGESTMWLEEGEIVTVEQLLYGALIESGNDAAYMLGVAVAGDNKSFVKMMNEKAEELGCTNTHFANANGMQDKKHYTTAADFLLIAKAAFANETVRKVAGTKKYKMAATNKSGSWTMETHTDLLTKKGSGVVAGKTGYWESDDCSVALDYDQDGLNLIVVLFKANYSSRAKEAQKLLEYGRDAIIMMPAVTEGEETGEVRIRHGAETRLAVTPAETVPAYPKNGTPDEITVRVTKKRGLVAPVRAGDEVGTITILVDGETLTEIPALAAVDVKTGWLPSYFYISNRQTVYLGIGLLVLLLVIYRIRKRRKNKSERVKAKRAIYQQRAAEKRARREAEAAKLEEAAGEPEPEDRYL